MTKQGEEGKFFTDEGYEVRHLYVGPREGKAWARALTRARRDEADRIYDIRMELIEKHGSEEAARAACEVKRSLAGEFTSWPFDENYSTEEYDEAMERLYIDMLWANVVSVTTPDGDTYSGDELQDWFMTHGGPEPFVIGMMCMERQMLSAREFFRAEGTGSEGP